MNSISATRPGRLAVLCDIVEESWPSMDLVGEMLVKNLQSDHAATINVTRFTPTLRRRFTHLPFGNGRFFNADRFLNRFWDYQRWLGGQAENFDLFHVIDHSYGQLLHHLPAERTIITCHDLDTFRCLIEPNNEPRSIMFRKMMRHVLEGFRKAALVACDSAATRDELLRHGLIAREKLRVVPLGVHPSCTAEPDSAADAEAARLLNVRSSHAIDLLHVGSTIKRKRIDVLLKVFSEVRRQFPGTRLIRVGGPFTPAQMNLVAQLNLDDAIIVLPHLTRDVLAAVYRQSALVLQPSEAEGFGLPVVEAMACGTPVLASDLPVLREVGGDAASYAPPGDVAAWSESVGKLLKERTHRPDDWVERRATGLTQAAKCSWADYARNMVNLYEEMLA